MGQGRLPGRVASALGVAALAFFLLPDLRTAAAGYGEGVRAEREHSYLPWRATLDFLGASELPGQVVASDPVTEYAIAGLTPQFVVGTLNQHASPSDSEAVARIQASLDIMNPGAGPARTAALLRRYGVDLVVVNHSYPHKSLGFTPFPRSRMVWPLPFHHRRYWNWVRPTVLTSSCRIVAAWDMKS